MINVVGTTNVFEVARTSGGQVERVVYASSAAVFGPPTPLSAGRRCATTRRTTPPRTTASTRWPTRRLARIHWEEHRVRSTGFRPQSVYGPGRDVGMTATPTLAMKAAVLGRPFELRWGGATDLIYAEDVARAFIRASRATLDRARVYNLHGSTTTLADVVKTIEAAWPSAKGLITHVEQPMPFPSALDDTRYQRELGPAPPTALVDGVRRTLDEFARLQNDGDSTRASSADRLGCGGRRGHRPHLQPGHRGSLATLETGSHPGTPPLAAARGPRHPVIVAASDTASNRPPTPRPAAGAARAWAACCWRG